MLVESLTMADAASFIKLNDACVPHVNRIHDADLEQFLAISPHCFKVTVADQTAAFVIALPTGCAYDSPNYQYFVRTCPRFLYIDRIMVEPAFRRRGVASFCYQHLRRCAETIDAPVLTCEVNVKPANPDSMALHLGLGFQEVGRQQTEQGTKEVALLALDVA